jgi:hypothetical protein
MAVLPGFSGITRYRDKLAQCLCLDLTDAWSVLLILPLIAVACGTWETGFAQTRTATSTTLSLTSGIGPVTTVTSGSVVTLTASVTTTSALVTVGQVNFCDASVAYCTDIHLIGTAQLTSAGTAVIKFQPGLGSHSYRAVFAGANSYSSSSSTASPLSVTGPTPTTTTIQTASTSTGSYNLTTTVSGFGSTAPTGSISFTDISDSNTILGSAPLSAGTAGLNFVTLPNVPTGQGANGVENTGIVAGDFNNDGILDLAVLDGGMYGGTSGSIAVLLGTGGGNFHTVINNSATGEDSVAIVSADFNGDGIPDLAVADGLTDTVRIQLGNGDGTFSPSPTSPATGNGPNFMIAADFNDDGIPDLAVVNGTDNDITILLGKGDGTFTPTANSQQTGSAPYFVATADFNGDGIPDLAVLNNNSGTDTLTIYLGTGTGGFTLVTTGPGTGTAAAAIAVGDFNGDGVPDIAIANSVVGGMAFPYSTATVTVSVLQGNGDGTFQQETGVSFQSVTGAPADALLTADFNNDGNADLAVDLTSGDSIRAPNYVTVLLGNGSSTFTTTAISSETGLAPAPLVTGDFNGDGVSDLANVAHSGEDGPGFVNILLSANQTATATANEITLPPSTGTGLVVASYPGDSNFSASMSTSATLTAPAGTATVGVTSSAANPVPDGALVTITASVTGAGLTPTGMVTFYDSSGQLAASQLQNGVATYTSTAFSVGSHSIVVQYAGDANYTPSTSPVLTLTVEPGSATVTITPSSTTITTAQSLGVTVNVGGSVGNPPPTGTVILTGGNTSLISNTYTSSPATLVNGNATFMIPPSSLYGYDVILVATYKPDAASAGLYAGSGAETRVIVTGAQIPAVNVTPSATSITNQQSVNVTVTVAGTSGYQGPTGAITLTSGSYSVQMALPYAPPATNPAVTFTIPGDSLSEGSNTLTAAYTGDATYVVSSGTATITVSPVVLAVPAPSPVAPGSSATATVTVTTGSAYSGTVNLSCKLSTSPLSAQSLPTCSLDPTTLTVAADASKTTTITVNTTAASAALVWPLNELRSIGQGGLALAGLLMFGTSLRRRGWLSVLALIAIAVGFAAIGCGGKGGGGGGSPSPTPSPTAATTAGAYVFTVTATDSTNSGIIFSSTVNVTVQ